MGPIHVLRRIRNPTAVRLNFAVCIGRRNLSSSSPSKQLDVGWISCGLHHGRVLQQQQPGRRCRMIASLARDVLWPPSNITQSPLSLHGFVNSAHLRRTFANRSIGGALFRREASGGSAAGGDLMATAASNQDEEGEEGRFDLVYKGPLRSAVRAVKVFSLSTCTIALVGAPVLVMMGNPTVPLIGRVLMTSFVMAVGISTTLILHWLMKGYVIEMYFDPKSEKLRVYTLTMLASRRCRTFHLSEAGPPESLAAFSTFQAQGKSYFMHTEVMENKELLGKILGPYMAMESGEFWKQDKKSDTTAANENKTQ